MNDTIDIPYTSDANGVVTPAPTRLVPAPPKAFFVVKMDGLTANVTDASARGGLPIDHVHYTFSQGPAVDCAQGAALQRAYTNESQRMITAVAIDTAGNSSKYSKAVYPKTPTPSQQPPSDSTPSSDDPAPASPPPPPSAQPAFTLQIMDPNPDLPDAIVTGTAGGQPVNITVKPGQCVPLGANADGTYNFALGSIVYWPDGSGIEPENSYCGEGNPTPADLDVSLHIVCGDKVWDTGDLTIEYRCVARPFVVAEQTIKDFDRSKFPKYGDEAANASCAGAYANADNSLMGPGLETAQVGVEGANRWLSLYPDWDLDQLENPSDENAAVVLGMSYAANVFPFHARDSRTNRVLNAYDYQYTSMQAPFLGKNDNPFKPYRTSIPTKRTLDGVTGHAPAWHVLDAAMFQSMRAKGRLSEYTAYLCCWQANYGYRLPNGPTKFSKEEGARGAAWTTRQLAQAAQWSDQPELFAGWLDQRLDELTTVLGNKGPLPIVDAWLAYPTNDTSTGWGFARWQVVDFLGQALGYTLQLGFTKAQTVFNTLANIAMDSMDKRPHELSTIYWLTACENGDRANGRRAQSWDEAMQFHADTHKAVANALACPEGSVELQSAYANLPAGQLPPNTKAGDFVGYPTSDTGYASNSQPMYAYMVDFCTTDPARALAVWNKFTAARAGRVKWGNNMYNIVPRRAA